MAFYDVTTFPMLHVQLLMFLMRKSTSLKDASLAPVAQSIEYQLWGTGGHGFDPGLRHTEVVKNGTCSSLGTQTYRVELGLVDAVSG